MTSHNFRNHSHCDGKMAVSYNPRIITPVATNSPPGVVMACDSRHSSYSTQSRSILMGFARGGSNPPLVSNIPAAYMDSVPVEFFFGPCEPPSPGYIAPLLSWLVRSICEITSVKSPFCPSLLLHGDMPSPSSWYFVVPCPFIAPGR